MSTSIILFVGRENYTIPQFIAEAKEHGVSKRIPAQSIPEGLFPGVSRILLASKYAILRITNPEESLASLGWELYTRGDFGDMDYFGQAVDPLLQIAEPYWFDGDLPQPPDYIPDGMLAIACALDASPDREELIEKFGIEFMPGIFGYTYLEEVQAVLHKDGSLPKNLEPIVDLIESGYVKPVVVEYEVAE